MKTILTVAIVAVAVLALAACTSKKQGETAESQPTKTLVLYYSQTGATDSVAQAIASALGADIEAIELAEPYSGSYEETIQRCLKEMADSVVPEIKPLKADLAEYGRVFLGYPIWFGTYARPIFGLLAVTDFAGKEVVPFCTFGSGGLEASTSDLKAALPQADVKDGYGVRNARIADMPAEVNTFLIAQGYIEGELEQLPEYSEQQPVTDEDVAVFNAACGDYQFPLGTPVTVGKRANGTSTDYIFTVESMNPQGQPATATIYVIAPVEGKPVFTKVVR